MRSCAQFKPHRCGAEGDTWASAYGKMLGTIMVAAWLEVALSFAPPSVLKRVFPPVVSGTAVFLIGASLITAGIKCALARSTAMPSHKCASTSARNHCCCMLHCFAALYQFDAAPSELQKFRCLRLPLCAATGVAAQSAHQTPVAFRRKQSTATTQTAPCKQLAPASAPPRYLFAMATATYGCRLDRPSTWAWAPQCLQH